MDCQAYKAYVHECAIKKMSNIIANGNLDHAKILIGTFFLFAHDTIKIFSSKLISQIYEDEEVLNNAEQFLAKNKKVEVLLQDIDEQNNDIDKHKFIEINKRLSQQSNIKTVSPRDKKITSHFVIMDELGFRFCPIKTVPQAIASFNQPRIAKNLVKQFDKLYSRGNQLQLS
jgi:thymidine kinase